MGFRRRRHVVRRRRGKIRSRNRCSGNEGPVVLCKSSEVSGKAAAAERRIIKRPVSPSWTNGEFEVEISKDGSLQMGSSRKLDGARIVKCAISLAVFAVSRASRFVRILAGRKLPGSCVILYYHSVLPAHHDLFSHTLAT